MITVILVIHIMIAIALVVVVLMQRSEGGALGMGGGGGGGGFLTGRGTANLLTRTTAVLAICFFLTSIGLTLLANTGQRRGSAFDGAGTPPAATDTKGGESGQQPAPPANGGGGLLDDLEKGRAPLPRVPGNR